MSRIQYKNFTENSKNTYWFDHYKFPKYILSNTYMYHLVHIIYYLLLNTYYWKLQKYTLT